MQNILIYGAGGLGREVLATLEKCSLAGLDLACAGFVVDPVFGGPEIIHGVPVYRDLAPLTANQDWRVVVAIGNPAARRRAVLRIQQEVGDRFFAVIHPAAQLGPRVDIGPGTMILGVVTITTDVTIGRHVLINPAATISHDCRLHDYATLGPATALAGGVIVGEGAELGVGVNAAPRTEIEGWSIVGAGALVLQNIPSDCTAVGTPTRIIKRRQAGWHLALPPT